MTLSSIVEQRESASASRWIVSALSLLLCVLYAWLATGGNWNIFQPTGIGLFYDSQFESFLHGHLDVPPNAIENEAYIHEGRSYGYFGPVPALLRGPVLLVAPNLRGKLAILSCLIAAVITLRFAVETALLIFGAIGRTGIPVTGEKIWIAAWCLLLGLASPFPIMFHPVNLFHEAILWGVAFAVASTYWYIRFAISGNPSAIFFGVLAAALALFSRPTIGIAMCIYPLWVAVRSMAPWIPMRSRPLQFMPALGVLAASSGSILIYFGLNFVKFGTINGLPLSSYYLFIHHPGPFLTYTFKLRNVPYLILNYLNPAQIGMFSSFPYFGLTKCVLSDAMKIDVYCEPSASLTSFSTALSALCLTGIILIFLSRMRFFRQFKCVTVCAALPAFTLFAFHAHTVRYMHDFFPLLGIAGATGICYLAAFTRRRIKVAAAIALAVIGLLNAFQAIVLALQNKV